MDSPGIPQDEAGRETLLPILHQNTIFVETVLLISLSPVQTHESAWLARSALQIHIFGYMEIMERLARPEAQSVHMSFHGEVLQLSRSVRHPVLGL